MELIGIKEFYNMALAKLFNPRLLEEKVIELFRSGLIEPEYIALELSNRDQYWLPANFVDNKVVNEQMLTLYIKEVLGNFESKALVENIYSSKLILPENEKKYLIYNEKLDKILGKVNDTTLKEILKGEKYKSLVKYGLFEGYNPKLNKRFYEDNGKQYFNTYEPPEWRLDNWYRNAPIVATNIPECYLKFFKHLTDNREPDMEYLFDWMAISLQKRNFTYLVTVGSQGVGKGIAGKIMQAVHGSTNYVELASSSLKKQFNKQLKNKTLIYFNEAMELSGEVAEKIKLLNEEYTEIELKGIDAEITKNFANYYFSSNNYDAFQVDEGNRRFSFIDLTDKRYDYELQNGAELFKPENVRQFAHHLYTRKYDPKWETYVYKSNTTELILESRYTEWQVYLLEDFHTKYKGDTISLKDMIAHLKNKAYRVQWGDLRAFLLKNKSRFHLNSKSNPKDATVFYDYTKLQLCREKIVLETTAKQTSMIQIK